MSRLWKDEAINAAVVPLDQLFATQGGKRGFSPLATPYESGEAFRANLPFIGLDPVSEPEIDPEVEMQAAMDQIHAEGFAAGITAARAETETARNALHNEVKAMLAALDQARTLDKAALGPALTNLVLDLVRQIVGNTVEQDPAFVRECVNRALATMKEAHGPARLLLHPEDIEMLGDIDTAAYPNLTIAADPEMPRGTVRLQADGGEIEDGVRPRIARLEEAFRATSIAA